MITMILHVCYVSSDNVASHSLQIKCTLSYHRTRILTNGRITASGRYQVYPFLPSAMFQFHSFTLIDRFGITAGLTLIHAQYTSRGDKTQRLPAKWRQRQSPFHYDVIPTSHLSPENASPAVIPKRSYLFGCGYQYHTVQHVTYSYPEWK